jgi:chromosome segregation ATPase
VVAQKSAAERAEQEKLSALEALREELNNAHAERMAEAERRLRSEHADEREGMARRHANEVSELTERHRLESTRLSKALTDAETRFAMLEERFEDSERARTSAETQLQATRQERDHLSGRANELGSQLDRAQARIERDNQLLERVRKAMAIGLGLLEEQKQDPAS